MSSAAQGEPTVVLWHGTTLHRAQELLDQGPDLSRGDDEFHMAPTRGPYPVGSPEEYARQHAIDSPEEGGPAILEVQVPGQIARLAYGSGEIIRFPFQGKEFEFYAAGHYAFSIGHGLAELIAAWPNLNKRVFELAR